ncbi:phospholipase D-like domain-containing protein, partial [Klebsiella pneumoniae]
LCSELNIISSYTTTLSRIYEKITNYDEEVIDIEDDIIDTNYSKNIHFALAAIDDMGNITGVPEISDELKCEILKRDKKIRERAEILDISKSDIYVGENINETVKTLPKRLINKEQVRLIAGPEEHRMHLFNSIINAKSRLIIHSTFINEECIA